MKVLGIIPARGGSKGVPGKNKRPLAGKPLVTYTIEAAKQAKGLHDLILSSDDDDIIQLARDVGIEVPFKRPEELSTDSASSLDVVQHAVDQMKRSGRFYDAICLLQPTTPFRTALDIDLALDRFNSDAFDSLVSVREVPRHFHPEWVYVQANENTLALASGKQEPVNRRQNLSPAFYRDGSIYLTRTGTLNHYGNLYGERVGYVVSESIPYVNIDTLEDWEQAEQLMRSLT